MGKVYSGTAQLFENKAIPIDFAGAIVLRYVKAIPVPGFEANISRRGKPQILAMDSLRGKIPAVICYGLDFPHYSRQTRPPRLIRRT